MNTATADKPATSQVKLLPLISISPNPDNPRRIDDKHPSLPGLAQSIQGVGLLNPITVRETEPGTYLILAGERRFRAARMVEDLKEILCHVVDVTDEQAFEIINVENLQREDLHWLEEARGVEAMVKHGWDTATIAQHIGKSESWVHLRAKLAKISPKWKAAVENPNGDYANWPASMLELISRFPIETQDAMIKERGWELKNCTTAAELQKHLEQEYLRLLKSAPWDLDDIKLVAKAGACSACPKRSSCQQQLFATTKGDSCLDASCWQEKKNAHVVAAVAVAKKAEPKAILLTDRNDNGEEIAKQFEKAAHEDWQFDKAKPGAKGAVPAIYVTGPNAGKTVHVTPKKGYGGESTRSPAGNDGKPQTIPLKERLATFMKRRTRQQILDVVVLLGGKRDGSPYKMKYEDPKAAAAEINQPGLMLLISMAMALGLPDGGSWEDYVSIASMKPVDREKDLWDMVRKQAIQSLMFDAMNAEADPLGAKAMAEACRINWDRLARTAQDENPLPKTLAEHFNEDGSPKTGLTAKKKTAKKNAAKAK